jgi:predicted transcriptional regulator of viral defense system
MKNRHQVLKNIKKNIFSSKDALLLGLNYHDLNVLEINGEILKLARGIYQKSGKESIEVDSYGIALAHLGGPAAICLWSALAFHELTEEVPEKIWVYVPIGKYSHLNTVKVVRKKHPFWDIGIETIKGIRVTDINRTLIDALYDKKHISETESFKMIHTALKNKKTSIKKLFEMANKLGVNKSLKLKLSLLKDSYV